MKNFMINIRRKSILVLLPLISAILLLFVGFTMSKYVIEKQVGTLTLNLTSADILLPGQQFRAALDTSVTFSRYSALFRSVISIYPVGVS